MLDQVLHVHALLRAGHEHVKLAVVEDSQPAHRHTLAESVDKSVGLWLDSDVQPVVSDHVDVSELVRIGHFNLGSVGQKVNLGRLPRHSILIRDLEVQLQVANIAVVLSQKVQVLVVLEIERFQIIE